MPTSEQIEAARAWFEDGNPRFISTCEGPYPAEGDVRSLATLLESREAAVRSLSMERIKTLEKWIADAPCSCDSEVDYECPRCAVLWP